MKILVVDDDLELSNLIGYALRQAGYMVIEAGDGVAALAAFERESPALVVLDVNLPRLSGLRGLPADPRRLADADHDAHRPERRGGPGAGARPRGGRLPDQALQPAHPARPRAGAAAPGREEKPAPLVAGDLRARPRAAVGGGGAAPTRCG